MLHSQFLIRISNSFTHARRTVGSHGPPSLAVFASGASVAAGPRHGSAGVGGRRRRHQVGGGEPLARSIRGGQQASGAEPLVARCLRRALTCEARPLWEQHTRKQPRSARKVFEAALVAGAGARDAHAPGRCRAGGRNARPAGTRGYAATGERDRPGAQTRPGGGNAWASKLRRQVHAGLASCVRPWLPGGHASDKHVS